jgi:hypothetical protein
MPSYTVKMADSANKLLVVDVKLPFFGAFQEESDPDSTWTAENPHLIAYEMGRCRSASTDYRTSTLTNDPDDDFPPASGDAAIPAFALGAGHLYLFTPIPPYSFGIMLIDFFSTINTNQSGIGQLYSAWTISGGLAAGQITWVQL